MRILITGGAGFIGSNLVEELIKERHSVRVIDNLSVSDHNIKDLKKWGADFVKADIGNFEEIKDLFEGYEVVLHLAAMNRAQRSIENPLLANKTNITGTLNVLEASRKSKVKKFINISSSSVYKRAKGLLTEDMPLEPPHPYGLGKLAGEHYARLYHNIYKLNTITLRIFSVYGPRQLGDIENAAVIPKFIHKILNNQQIEIYGSGNQKRNFTFVGDVVKSIIKAMETDLEGYEIINIANDKEIGINEIKDKIEDILGEKAKVVHTDPLVGDPERNPADTSKAKNLLNYVPTTSIEDGLKDTIRWFKK